MYETTTAQRDGLPTRWIGGTVLGSILDYPARVSLIIETPDGTVVRVKGVVEVVQGD